MITGAILSVIGGIATFMLGLLPASTSTDIATGAFSGGLATLISKAVQLDSWIPWEVIPIFLLVFGTTWGATLLVNIIRRLVSHFTGGGGAI